jgi:predicted nucleic acid-binding protein
VSGYFLDTSALAKLYHQEPGSGLMESLAEAPGAHLIISELSLIEIESVFAIKVRTGAMAKGALDHLRGLFNADITKGRLNVVLLARRHFRNAGALVRLYATDYALRTLDALQVSVAMDLKRRGVISELVASDRNLCNVAALEGLTVINPSENS